jgi:hypothetical protein
VCHRECHERTRDRTEFGRCGPRPWRIPIQECDRRRFSTYGFSLTLFERGRVHASFLAWGGGRGQCERSGSSPSQKRRRNASATSALSVAVSPDATVFSILRGGGRVRGLLMGEAKGSEKEYPFMSAKFVLVVGIRSQWAKGLCPKIGHFRSFGALRAVQRSGQVILPHFGRGRGGFGVRKHRSGQDLVWVLRERNA